MCVPRCESRSDGTDCAQSPEFIDTVYEDRKNKGEAAKLTYGTAPPVRVARVPPYYVGEHNTETDHFSVPCSADFFLDQQWGYINAATESCDGGKAETCAGATFEPAKSLNEKGHEGYMTKAGGLMLHMKMFPRPAIMRSPGRSPDALSETSVLCLAKGGGISYYDNDGCKVILVHENYFKGSVWQAGDKTKFYYADSDMSTADDSGLYSDGPRGMTDHMPYTVSTSGTFETYADAFDIYNHPSTAKETYTAYPDHFSYEWCSKCSPDQLKMKEETGRGWVWRSSERFQMDTVTVRKMMWIPADAGTEKCLDPVHSTTPEDTPCWNWQDFTRTESTSFGADFGGNCEGATYIPEISGGSKTPAGETVPFRTGETYEDRMPAYHPQACTGSVVAA